MTEIQRLILQMDNIETSYDTGLIDFADYVNLIQGANERLSLLLLEVI